MADITTEENASVALIVSSPIHRKCLCSGCANGEPDTLKGNANSFEVLNTLDVEEDSGNMKSNRLGGPCTSVSREMSSRRWTVNVIQSLPEHPKDKTGLDAFAKLARAKLNKRSGDAELSKDKSGLESPLEFQRSWKVRTMLWKNQAELDIHYR
ncbi:hypothetical protein Tco_1330134 [Tanacetum coccineum]